jgi:hypothetical protein
VKTTIVENRADPAAKPSRPSIRLKALVIARTQMIVAAKPTYQGEDTVSEQDRNIYDSQTAGVQHGGGNSLHREFHIGADAAKIVVHTEQKDDGGGYEDGSQRLQKVRRMQGGMTHGPENDDAHANAETQEDRYSTQTRQARIGSLFILRQARFRGRAKTKAFTTKGTKVHEGIHQSAFRL